MSSYYETEPWPEPPAEAIVRVPDWEGIEDEFLHARERRTLMAFSAAATTLQQVVQAYSEVVEENRALRAQVETLLLDKLGPQ